MSLVCKRQFLRFRDNTKPVSHNSWSAGLLGDLQLRTCETSDFESMCEEITETKAHAKVLMC